ncbi:acyl carrier protein [uncultured Sphaerochaeta sp.]|uniref:acyl carrier protein n=1 Tax=uncultured Sphaerochaeta sp. TaxID=886478 RepID=UPI002A0A19D4|nr:acyl carrier protein [uncultured Sphaerochaeta sp.]
MTNNEKYVEAFKQALQLDDSVNIEALNYRDSGWDSVAHMVIMATLEDSFDIMMDTDDVIDFSSFKKGKEILGKYDVEFN